MPDERDEVTEPGKLDPNRPDSTRITPKRSRDEIDDEEEVVPQRGELEKDEAQTRDEGRIDKATRRYLEAEQESEEVRRSNRKDEGPPIP